MPYSLKELSEKMDKNHQEIMDVLNPLVIKVAVHDEKIKENPKIKM